MVYKPKYNKGLQQQNFKEILQEMVGIESWNLLKDNDLLALIAP